MKRFPELENEANRYLSRHFLDLDVNDPREYSHRSSLVFSVSRRKEEPPRYQLRLTLELLEWVESPERLREILDDQQIAEKMKQAGGKIVWINRGDLIGE
jgi:hypothetical protein